MLEWDPASWGAWMWFLHAFGAVYVLGYVVFALRFTMLERQVRAGRDGARQRLDKAKRGFPAAFYAKMLGRGPGGGPEDPT